MEIMTTKESPLRGIDVSFANYVRRRRQEEQNHLQNGVPDYAFALDRELKKRLDQIPHFKSICKKICATIETREIQIFNQQALAVGPAQYPQLYQMGLDCAHRLGIGVPNIFVFNSTEMNAFTYASDTTSPMIVIYTGILDRMTPGEIKCIIGHECGHIHNQHAVYQNVIQKVLKDGTGWLGQVLSGANLALMQFWVRACEVTSDRASMICADDVKDARSVQERLLSGAALNQDYRAEFDLDSLEEQLKTTLNNPTRIMEILSDHPSSIRRIFACKEFEECEVFYRWRPELKKPGIVMRSKEETDERCRKLVNIVQNK